MNHRTRNAIRRRGSMLVMVAVLMVVVMAMVAYSVDVAYMQLTRTELRVANDAATKAGTLALIQSDGNANQAKAAAIQAAARNKVGGRPYALTAENIEVGHSERQGNGTWQFVANSSPFNSLRINGQVNESTPGGAIPLIFGSFVGRNTFEPQQLSVASSLEQEICLAVDRSHSMCFDLSGVDWSYPPGTPMTPHPIAYPPHSSLSRWASLRSAIREFVQTVLHSNYQPRVSLVTWGSEIGQNTAEFSITGKTENAVAFEVPLLSVIDDEFLTVEPVNPSVLRKIKKRSENLMLGGTNMAAGIDTARSVLTASDVRPLARKTMILMTDGQWNQGRNPLLAAQEAKDAGIVIHTVAFLSQADQTTMQQIAELTGGKFYDASNTAQLEDAFRELALTLPIVLTK